MSTYLRTCEIEFAKSCVKALADLYGFDEEEAINILKLSEEIDVDVVEVNNKIVEGVDVNEIKKNLSENGYCVVPNVLNSEEITEATRLFRQWQTNTPTLEHFHNTVDPHGIYKHHEAGHQEFAWYIRTNPKIIEIYKQLWNTDELVVSFDGSCYIPKNCVKKDKIWTHTDQSPANVGFKCLQGFVSLTSNVERTLMVYDKSHLNHESYFKEYPSSSPSSNWQLIDHTHLSTIQENKKILNVPAGSLVLWDSRTFHQNRFGVPSSEERIVQYICYLPKNHKNNTLSQQKKRKEYFNKRRMTSHWPYPIHVNSLQARTFGDDSKLIDYSVLQVPDLDRFNISPLL
jgi:hypothetical protein